MQTQLCPMVWGALKYFDQRIAEQVKACGCPKCGGILDWASFPRKPRGIENIGDERRLSLCCRICRKRVTPGSLRFLWKKVYVLWVVAIESVKPLLRVSRRTVGRWRQFWASSLSVQSPFIAFRRRFLPIEFSFDMPGLLKVFASASTTRVVALTDFLSPLGCAAWLRFKDFRAEDAR